ncbi:hypothetical protein AAY473_014994 [Plecturocebus cupreus]
MVYMCHIFFIQSIIDGHLGWFQVFAIINSAATAVSQLKAPVRPVVARRRGKTKEQGEENECYEQLSASKWNKIQIRL